MNVKRMGTEHIIENVLTIRLNCINEMLKSRSKENLALREENRFKSVILNRFIYSLNGTETDRQAMDYLMQQIEEGREDYSKTRDKMLYYRVGLAKDCIREMIIYI